MTAKYNLVVSAENNPYSGWQCKLFYFSCVTRLQQEPIIVVHDTNQDLYRDFQELRKAGCPIYRAPNFRITASGDDYYPRNTAGTLIYAANICAQQEQPIVLCDPDMIFLSQPPFPNTLAGDFCSYMNYDRPFVETAKRELHIERPLSEIEKETLRCSVPYVIPVACAAPLGEAWLKAVDAFPPRRWEDIMYAFGLAVVKLGLELQLTHLTDHNYWPDAPSTASMIHYCYGDARWSKRAYFTEEQAQKVWEPHLELPEGTILGAILGQIKAASAFYDNRR